MEKTSIVKQAKSDIFSELYPIINFYVKRGAKPQALKKYYRNNKRFNDVLEDIKNKGVNLIKDESEYKKLVRDILNEILDDFIAKEKDDEYKNKINKKMKHIKEFNSYKINEEFSWLNVFLTSSAIFFTYKFFQGLLKKKTQELKENPDDRTNKIKELENKRLEILASMVGSRLKNGTAKLEEDVANYIITFDFDKDYATFPFKKTLSKSLIVKLNRYTAKMNWWFSDEDENSRYSIQLTQEDVKELIKGIKEDIDYQNNEEE